MLPHVWLSKCLLVPPPRLCWDSVTGFLSPRELNLNSAASHINHSMVCVLAIWQTNLNITVRAGFSDAKVKGCLCSPAIGNYEQEAEPLHTWLRNIGTLCPRTCANAPVFFDSGNSWRQNYSGTDLCLPCILSSLQRGDTPSGWFPRFINPLHTYIHWVHVWSFQCRFICFPRILHCHKSACKRLLSRGFYLSDVTQGQTQRKD